MLFLIHDYMNSVEIKKEKMKVLADLKRPSRWMALTISVLLDLLDCVLYLSWLNLSADIIDEVSYCVCRWLSHAVYKLIIVESDFDVLEAVGICKYLIELIKGRQEHRVSTMIGCQYSPEEWPELMVETKKQGEADSIRRRLVNNAYII